MGGKESYKANYLFPPLFVAFSYPFIPFSSLQTNWDGQSVPCQIEGRGGYFFLTMGESGPVAWAGIEWQSGRVDGSKINTKKQKKKKEASRWITNWHRLCFLWRLLTAALRWLKSIAPKLGTMARMQRFQWLVTLSFSADRIAMAEM